MKKISNQPITERTLWHCNSMFGRTYGAKVCARLKFQNLSKFCSDLKKIGICFGNRPIADFFHDQTIFLKDYELYIIGHSLMYWHQCTDIAKNPAIPLNVY